MRLSGRRMLLVSSIDFERVPHSSDRARVAQYSAWGTDMTAMYLRQNTSRRVWDLIRDTLSFRTRHTQEDGAHTWRIDPPFNYCAGLRTAGQTADDDGIRRTGVRWTRWFAGLSILRDMFAWPAFVLFALVRLRGRWDAAIGSGPYGAFVCWVLTRLGKARVFVYLDRDYGPGLLRPGARRAFAAWLESFLIRRADVAVSVSRRLVALRTAQTGRVPTYLPNGVDVDRFVDRGAERLPTLRLLYVGALFPHAGVDLAIRAMPQIRSQHPQAELIIVGHGPDEERLRLERLIRESGLESAVHWLGRRRYDELPALMHQADIGLANSVPNEFRTYACPLKVLEYMAAGLPVIATEGTEAADLVRAAGAGTAVPFEVGAFSNAAGALVADATDYETMRDSARRFAGKHAWTRLLMREVELLEERLARTMPEAAPVQRTRGAP